MSERFRKPLRPFQITSIRDRSHRILCTAMRAWRACPPQLAAGAYWHQECHLRPGRWPHGLAVLPRPGVIAQIAPDFFKTSVAVGNRTSVFPTPEDRRSGREKISARQRGRVL